MRLSLCSPLSLYLSLISKVLSWSSEGRRHNIICVATVMSPGEFCSPSLLWVIYILRCVKPSLTSYHERSTHTRTHKCRHEHRFISQHTHPTHIYEVTFVCVCVCVRDGADFGLRPPPVGSVWPLPLFLLLSVISFFLFLVFSLSFWLLSRWYISCSWHGSCIAYG